MKKRMLPMILVCSVMLCQPVMAMEQGERTPVRVSESGGIVPFASDYIESFNGNLKYMGEGRLKITGNATTRGADKTEIQAQLQSYSDGKWSNYGTVMKVSDEYRMVEMKKEKTVPDGKYRVKFTFNAYVGSKVAESRTLTTTSVTVKK